jgi:excinuclease UvrABC nuclease subunit
VLSVKTEFRSENDVALFAALPAAPAVFLLRGAEPGGEPYIGKTSNLRRRIQRLLGQTEGISKRLNLRDRVRWLEFQRVGSDFEAGLLLYRVLREEFARTYQDRLRLRPAPLIKLILENAYPRLAVTIAHRFAARRQSLLRTFPHARQPPSSSPATRSTSSSCAAARKISRPTRSFPAACTRR